MKRIWRSFRGIDNETIKSAGLQAIFWLAIAIGGFQGVYMREQGYSASTIGIINAVGAAISIFAVPFWGMICDKLNSVKKVVIMLFFIGGILLYLFVPTSANIELFGLPVLMIMIPVLSFFRYPFFTLLDNWLVQNSQKKGLAFGPIRSFGSFAYGIGGMVMSAILPALGVAPVFYISAVVFIFVIWISSRVEDVTPAEAHEEKKSFRELGVGRLFKNYYFVIFLVFTFAYQLVVNSDTNFLTFLLEDVGAMTTDYGLICGIRALVEIPVLLYYKKLSSKTSFFTMIGITSVTLGVGMVLTGGISSNLLHVIIFSVFIGAASGLNIGCSANYVYKLAPDGLKATAHTIYSAVTYAASIVGSLFGGQLIDRFSATTYYLLLGIFLLAALVLYVGMYAYGRKRGKTEAPAVEEYIESCKEETVTAN